MKLRKLITLLTVSVGVVWMCDSALAADQIRDRKRDGSCKTTSVQKIQKRDRKRDGSCQRVTATKDQSRDRKRDGSCK